MGLAMPIGDAAGWATAVATAALAVIAYVQLGGQRKELSGIGDQLQALQAEELELRLAPQRRDEYRARRKQAQQVHLERRDGVPLLVGSTSTTPTSYSYLAVTNASGQPVRTVTVTFGDDYAFDVGKLDLAAPAPQQLQDRRGYTLSEIPPGETWYFLVYTAYQNEVADSEVSALFTDANGVEWRKNLISQLDEIQPPKSPPAS